MRRLPNPERCAAGSRPWGATVERGSGSLAWTRNRSLEAANCKRLSCGGQREVLQHPAHSKFPPLIPCPCWQNDRMPSSRQPVLAVRFELDRRRGERIDAAPLPVAKVAGGAVPYVKLENDPIRELDVIPDSLFLACHLWSGG